MTLVFRDGVTPGHKVEETGNAAAYLAPKPVSYKGYPSPCSFAWLGSSRTYTLKYARVMLGVKGKRKGTSIFPERKKASFTFLARK